MSVYKRGRTYWFEFVRNGERFQKSTGQRNYKAAVDIENAFRTALAKGDVGITERKPTPSLKEFEKQFIAWVEENKKNVRTQEFYKAAYSRLLGFSPLARAHLDQIDEALIERFKSKILAEKIRRTTINRYLATLRKALRYASRKLKLFDKLPIIDMYTRDDGAERHRKFIFGDADYKNWLAIAPEPLCSASILAREAGICRGEMLALQRDCINLSDEPDDDGLFGQVEIKRGLKRKERERMLPVNREMCNAIVALLARSRCAYLFTALGDATRPLSAWTLEDQLRRTRTTLSLDTDAGLHTLRHTFLTEMGRKTDGFTLQRIAGHANIATTQRYVHPKQDAIRAAFCARTVPTKAPTATITQKREAVYN
ncbi:MAG: tyrosine-type recombinase/integrase [Candidatus Acidiferrales bacterium]